MSGLDDRGQSSPRIASKNLPAIAGEKILLRVWLSLAAIFGSRWTAQMGDRPQGATGAMWLREIQDLTPEQIDQALQACRYLSAKPNEFPPCPAVFRVYALGVPPWNHWMLTFRDEGFSSPFGQLIWRLIGPGRSKRSVDRRLEYGAGDSQRKLRILQDAYDLAIEWVIAGRPIEAEDTPVARNPAPSQGNRSASATTARGNAEAAYRSAVDLILDRFPDFAAPRSSETGSDESQSG